MNGSARHRLPRLLIGVAALAFPHAAMAQDGSGASVDISVGAEVATNPFLLQDGAEAESVFIRIDPTLILEDGRHRTVITANGRLTQYSNNYGTDVSGNVGVASDRAISERTNLVLDARAGTSRTGFRDALGSASRDLLAGEDVGVPQAPALDTTVLGTRTRVTSFVTSASVAHRIDPVSNIKSGISFEKSFYDSGAGFDHSNANGYLSYQRQVALRTSIVLTGAVSNFDYSGRQRGDSKVYGITAGVNQDIGSNWLLSARGGVNIVDRNLELMGGKNVVLFSGDLGLCNRRLGNTLCVTAQRSAQPTGLGGLSQSTSAQARYAIRLSDDEMLTLNAQFARTEQIASNGFSTENLTSEAYGVMVRYRRELSKRATLFAEASYYDYSDDFRNIDGSFAVMAGITIRIGSQN